MDIKNGIAVVAAAAAIGYGTYEGTVSDTTPDSVAPNEIVSMRSETSETFSTGKPGRCKALVYADPIHYRTDDDLEWKKIDPQIKAKPLVVYAYEKLTGGRPYEIQAGPYAAEFYGEGKESNYKFTAGGASIEFEATHDTTGIAVSVQSGNAGVKEALILSEKAATKLSWAVTVSNGTIRESGAGWTVINHDGIEAFRVDPITAMDAKGKVLPVKSGLESGILSAEVMTEGAAFPVTVDPSVRYVTTDSDALTGHMYYQAGNWADARNGTTASTKDATEIWAGTQLSSGNYRAWRSLLRFPYAVSAGATIDSVLVKTVVQTIGTVYHDWTLRLCAPTDTLSKKDFADGMLNEIKGWAASGAYSPTYWSDDALNMKTRADGDTLTYRLNTAGKATIAGTDTLQFWMMSSLDIADTEPDSSRVIRFEDDSPYITVYYTYMVPNTLYADTLFFSSVLTNKSTADAAYTNSRGAVASLLSATIDTLGQWFSLDGNYHTYRISLQTAKLPQWNQVTEARIILNGTADGSTTDFGLNLYEGTWTSLNAESSRFDLFDGYQTGMTAYNGTQLNSAVYTTTFNVGADTLTFNATGLTKLLEASQDTARFVILSSRDVSATSPSGAEYVVFNSTNARLEVTWALNDSTPTAFNMSAISKDSVLVTWRDRTFDEAGFKIVNAATGAKIDSVAADVQSARIGGLAVNTKYAWKVVVCGGVYADSSSAADSTYTLAVAPVTAPTTTMPSDSTVKFVIDTTGTGNPAYTEYAVQDSATGKYVDPLSGILDTLKSAAAWKTYDLWGAGNGDTVKIGVGKNWRIRVKARSGQ